MSARNNKRKIGPADAGFVLDDYVLYNLVRTAATYNEEMARALKRYGLDTMKWRILMLLADKSPSSVGELARRAVTKTPTLTRMLTRMENEDLVRRRAPKGDRRFVEITMTPKAVKTLRAVQAVGQRVFERAFDGVEPEAVAAVTAVLKHVRANLSRSPYDDMERRTFKLQRKSLNRSFRRKPESLATSAEPVDGDPGFRRDEREKF